jgi:hypothetical protein
MNISSKKHFFLDLKSRRTYRAIDPEHTRLIVRTHGRPLSSWTDNLEYFFIMPLHYLMERRMLMGIKARAEAGPGLPIS